MSHPVIRVRFAPSPTGFLHVGGARTALFNWLLARGAGGTFILRIEDTDRERSSDAMTAAIVDGLTWLGIAWDEGPHFQAAGIERHRVDALSLLERGAAYRCFCTPEDVERRRIAAGVREGAFRYDRLCQRIPSAEAARRSDGGEPYTLRFLVPEGVTAWDDVVHGPIEFANADIEDFIILRSDGTPIYNLAVVSDDVEMRITHVIRGADHISNTPKQILLYRALGRQLPVFGHLPLIHGHDGKRLSKRHGATAVDEYQRMGILPDAMVNFLALLGWSPGTDEEIFSRDELIARFSIEQVNRKAAIFDVQKLLWLNGQYLRNQPASALAPLIEVRLAAAGFVTEALLRADRDRLLDIIEVLKTRARTTAEIAAQAIAYFDAPVDYDPAAVRKHWKGGARIAERLQRLRDLWDHLETWSDENLESTLRALAPELGIGAGPLIHPLRVALIGSSDGPGIFDIVRLLGRDRVLARMDRAIDSLTASSSTA
ncbi:MAG: glutamate--tRNA ligase [Gemmatimonadetes bacterium]|nr:glutamate--tRNA ligase [Gemmatimonadota bacterium]